VRNAPGLEAVKRCPETCQTGGDPRTPAASISAQRVSFSGIELEDDNRGIILDVSERGLSLQAFGSLTDDQVPLFVFNSRIPAWIKPEANA